LLLENRNNTRKANAILILQRINKEQHNLEFEKPHLRNPSPQKVHKDQLRILDKDSNSVEEEEEEKEEEEAKVTWRNGERTG